MQCSKLFAQFKIRGFRKVASGICQALLLEILAAVGIAEISSNDSCGGLAHHIVVGILFRTSSAVQCDANAAAETSISGR